MGQLFGVIVGEEKGRGGREDETSSSSSKRVKPLYRGSVGAMVVGTEDAACVVIAVQRCS